MIPRFLRPEILSYASIEIVPAAPRVICAWCPDFDPTSPANAGASHTICAVCFHQLLTDPATAARLDAMLADNQRIDAAVVVELEIVPPAPEAPRGPVIDVVLVPKKDGGR